MNNACPLYFNHFVRFGIRDANFISLSESNFDLEGAGSTIELLKLRTKGPITQDESESKALL